jgi:hypothetical protein
MDGLKRSWDLMLMFILYLAYGTAWEEAILQHF